jgi:uncharacterized protein YdaU (DUF1376 family)
MAQFPGLMLWTDAWIADTVHLSRLERGIYIDLLVLIWRTPGCRVPNDDKWLAKHMRMNAKEVSQELRPIIREFCQCDGNHIFQKRLQKEFVRAFKIGRRMSVLRKRQKRLENDINDFRGKVVNDLYRRPDPERESFFGREDEQAKEEATEKKVVKVSNELIHTIAAKRSTG